MTDRSVWVRADDAVGDWERRKRRVTAALEAGADWVLVDHGDVARVRDLGEVRVAAFVDGLGATGGDSRGAIREADGAAGDDEDGDPTAVGASDGDPAADGAADGASDDGEDDPAADATSDRDPSVPDLAVVGKGGEGDGSVDLPPDLAGSADLSALRRADGPRGAFVRVTDEDHEEFARAVAAAADYTLVATEDWTVIPLENLIAGVGEETALVAGVDSAGEAETAFETLEAGVDGVLVDGDADAIRETVGARDAADRERVELRYGEVVAVERAGSADRVCVDTATLMDDDEGLLVGSMSRGLAFVHAETADSPYVSPRPFRVNAGAVHAYVRVPGGETRYLSELASGDEVLVTDLEGRTRTAVVGRAKIERRPMFRVAVDVDGDRVETLLQNAETVQVATPDGRRAVTDLQPGDEIRLLYDPTARHFGEAVEERIVEK